MNEVSKRVFRTMIQLIAGGGLTASVDMVVHQLSPQSAAMVMALSTLLVTFCQNWLEEAGYMEPLMK